MGSLYQGKEIKNKLGRMVRGVEDTLPLTTLLRSLIYIITVQTIRRLNGERSREIEFIEVGKKHKAKSKGRKGLKECTRMEEKATKRWKKQNREKVDWGTGKGRV